MNVRNPLCARTRRHLVHQRDQSLQQVDRPRRAALDVQIDRHNLLDRLVYVYTKKPPPVALLSKTSLQRVDTLVIPDVLFATNSFTLREEAKELLSQLTQKTGASRVDSVVVEGHTDSQGSPLSNQTLSENRAKSVSGYMQNSLQATFFTRGWASTKPAAENTTPAGRQKNRRVEIYIYLRE